MLKAVTNYEGAEYPKLEEYLQKTGQMAAGQQFVLAAALAALATLMGGCGAIS